MIKIVPYQPTWPQAFSSIAQTTRQALGNIALAVHHIGSTAVPALAAKDVIDVQITVHALTDTVRDRLKSAGFVHKAHIHGDHLPPGATEDPDEWRKMIFAERPGERRANIHVRVQGRANQRYPILFRDYLRAFPAQAEAYAQTKIALARYHADDAEAYYAIKDPVCDIIMGGAEQWAAQAGWQIPAGDG